MTDKADYTRALSASQVAYTMESLLSPVLAAIALSFMSFTWLFLGTSLGFVLSTLLVLSTRIPNARRGTRSGAWDRATSGIRTFLRTPRLRGIIALNLVVAAAGSIVIVNTVTYVRDELGGSQSAVAWMLAASGTGSLVAALTLPRVLDRITERTVMLTGAALLSVATITAAALTAAGVITWAGTAILWFVIGAGMATIVTPTGRILRGAVEPAKLPGVFAAQFSLSHLAWLLTYPIAGWLGTSAGLAITWSSLAVLAAGAAIAARFLWSRGEALDSADAPSVPLRPRTPLAAGAAAEAA